MWDVIEGIAEHLREHFAQVEVGAVDELRGRRKSPSDRPIRLRSDEQERLVIDWEPTPERRSRLARVDPIWWPRNQGEGSLKDRPGPELNHPESLDRAVEAIRAL